MIQLEKLTRRQKFILQLINQLESAGNQVLLERVALEFDQSSRVTLIRDLNVLLKKGLIQKSGQGRSVVYQSKSSPLQKIFDTETYFKVPPDRRLIQGKKLDFSQLRPEEIFTPKELSHVEKITKDFRKRLKNYEEGGTRREFERITIEFSWKSSQIEGSTYTLLETEKLLKYHQETQGKTREEALMILNHKVALEYAWAYAKDFKNISPRKVEDIHELLTQRMGIKRGIRKRAVGIVGTAYRPLDNEFQIKEALRDLCHLINRTKPPFLKALLAAAGVAYIQAFEDGNKRTSRLMGNAILMANDHCPISYRSIDETEYKKAMILFYEQHSIEYFKRLFLEQYEFATRTYFL